MVPVIVTESFSVTISSINKSSIFTLKSKKLPLNLTTFDCSIFGCELNNALLAWMFTIDVSIDLGSLEIIVICVMNDCNNWEVMIQFNMNGEIIINECV